MKRHSEAELSEARKRYGRRKTCPRCGLEGDIDLNFGWRRMRREDDYVVPQSHCTECRKTEG